MKRLRARWPHVLLLVAAGVGLLLGAGHFAATRGGRPPRASGCPFGSGNSQGQSFSLARMLAAPLGRHGWAGGPPNGQVEPPRAVSLAGLALNTSSRAQVDAWLAERGCTCRQSQSPLECRCQVPARLGALYAPAQKTTAFLTLDDRGQLSNLTLLSEFADAATIVAAYRASEAELRPQLGPSRHEVGAARSAYLSSGLLRQARSEYAEGRVLARLSATNLGGRFALEQRLQRLDDTVARLPSQQP